MVQVDLSGLAGLMPVFTFLLVFVLVYALLTKTEALTKNRFVAMLISFAVAIIFVVSTTAVKYVEKITPWFAVFAVTLVFLVLLVGVILKSETLEKVFTPGLGWFVLVCALIFFIISGIMVFGKALTVPAFFKQPQIWGIILLGAIAIFASWLLTRPSLGG